jgi:hypothetical protein
MRHAIVAADRVVADTLLTAHAPNGWTDGYFRVLQDSADRLMWIYGLGRDIYLYFGLDASGRTFGPPTHLSLPDHPIEYSGLSVATLRGGVTGSLSIDAVYPSGSAVIYARLRP